MATCSVLPELFLVLHVVTLSDLSHSSQREKKKKIKENFILSRRKGLDFCLNKSKRFPRRRRRSRLRDLITSRARYSPETIDPRSRVCMYNTEMCAALLLPSSEGCVHQKKSCWDCIEELRLLVLAVNRILVIPSSIVFSPFTPYKASLTLEQPSKLGPA